jgi:hypothetical protein
MRKILSFSILFVFIIASGAYAQFGGRGQQGPKFYGDFKPVVGSWAEYQMKGQGEAPVKMKVAVVGKEGSGYWYETVTQARERMVTKMLVSGNPNDRQNVKKIIVKSGSEQAMEMPIMGMGMGRPPAKPQKPAGKVIDKGMETVTVPAGTFTARHMQYQDGADIVDAWVSEKVPPYGLIKSRTKDFEMVLTGTGTGAKSLITETPKKFNMPKMPQGMPQGMMPGIGYPAGK